MSDSRIYGPAIRSTLAALVILGLGGVTLVAGLTGVMSYRASTMVLSSLFAGAGLGLIGSVFAALCYGLVMVVRGSRVGMREAWKRSDLALKLRPEDADRVGVAEDAAKQLFEGLITCVKWAVGIGLGLSMTVGAIGFMGEMPMSEAINMFAFMGFFGFFTTSMITAIPTLARRGLDVAQATAHDQRLLRERRERVDASEVRGALHIAEHAGTGGGLSVAHHADSGDLGFVDERGTSDVVLDLGAEDASDEREDEVTRDAHTQEAT